MIKLETLFAEKQYSVELHKPHYIPLHWHQFYEIELVTEGTGTQILNGSEVPLRPHALTVLSPTDFHRLEPNTANGFQILHLGVAPEVLSEELISFFQKYSPPYFLILDESQSEKIANTLVEIQNLISQEDELSEAIVRRGIEQIFLEIMGLCANTPLPPPQNPQHFLSKFLPVIKYINEHYHEPIRRKQLADLVHMSQKYFGEQFKKDFGVSLFDYITDVRLRIAYSLLENTSEPIHCVIELVGFHSPSLFYRKFREYYKMRPSEIVRKYKKTGYNRTNEHTKDSPHL